MFCAAAPRCQVTAKISKKTMLIMNRAAVAANLSHAECIELLAETMMSVSKRDVIMPLRQFIKVPETSGKFTMMPGYLGDPRCFGVKLVSKYPPDQNSQHGSHIGAVMVFDAETGVPNAMLDGGELTAIRTSSASALATRELSREDSKVLTMMGCGDEARHHIQAVLRVRDLKDIIVWGRSPERAQKFVDQCYDIGVIPASVTATVEADAQAAVHKADIVCTVTASSEPILKGEWLTAGTHVNLVGAAIRSSSEADIEVVCGSKFYVDYRESALAQAGELINAIESGRVDETHIVGEIGEVLMRICSGRVDSQEITVYKSLGVSAQDLAAGKRAFENAQRNGGGVEVDW